MIEPIGCISTTKERLRFTLQNSQTVQDWSKTGEPRIFLDVISAGPQGRDAASKLFWEQLRPFILIHTMPITYNLLGEPGAYSPTGALVAMFEQNTPQENTPDGDFTGEDLERLFDNFMGQVITDIRHMAQTQSETFFYPTSITTDGPYRSEEEHYAAIGDAQQYFLQFNWGISS